MKVWTTIGMASLPDDRIVGNLLFDLVAQTSKSELAPKERLWVILESGHSCHVGYLTELYLQCGCFEEAHERFTAEDHQRKLGDVCWALGKLDAAGQHYSNPVSGAQAYRDHPDYDRQIKLAFYRQRWAQVVRLFTSEVFQPGFGKGRVICGKSEMAAKSYLEMLAVAAARSDSFSDHTLGVLESSFGMCAKNWDEFSLSRSLHGEAALKRLTRNCVPMPARQPASSVSAALQKGATSRAAQVLAYLKESPSLLGEAQRLLQRYGATGCRDSLDSFLEIVTRSGVTSMSHTFLFAAMGNGSFENSEICSERLASLYDAHPIMDKRHFGDLLKIKFERGLPIASNNILTGLFQQMSSFKELLGSSPACEFLRPARLAYFREWAEMRLADWLADSGSAAVDSVAKTWRAGNAEKVTSLFSGGTFHAPRTPRDMAEWDEMLRGAARWLEEVWEEEIGATTWVSENQLYQLLRKRLPNLEVQQHARPPWIEPQHLDVLIPEAAVAVEYMGVQHFEPVRFFGGEAALSLVQRRDQRKRSACEAHKVELIYVRHDERLADRVKSIVERVDERLRGIRVGA